MKAPFLPPLCRSLPSYPAFRKIYLFRTRHFLLLSSHLFLGKIGSIPLLPPPTRPQHSSMTLCVFDFFHSAPEAWREVSGDPSS